MYTLALLIAMFISRTPAITDPVLSAQSQRPAHLKICACDAPTLERDMPVHPPRPDRTR